MQPLTDIQRGTLRYLARLALAIQTSTNPTAIAALIAAAHEGEGQ